MARFELDGWTVDPDRNLVRRGEERVHLEPRVMDLLVHFAERPGRVLGRDELLSEVWRDLHVADAALHTAISALRRALRDDARRPRVLETIPRRGYRLIARVTRRRSIAVLPFENLSGEPDEEFFADGMTEALIGELGRSAELAVISRQSVMRWRGRLEPAPVIAETLGVELLVEGSAQRVGGRVRLTVKLLDGAADRLLWTLAYDRDLRDLLELQRELARAVAGEVRAQVAPVPSDSRPEVSTEAWIEFQRGLFHFFRLSPEHLPKAIEHLREATRLAPDFGDAHAALADVWGALAYWGAERSPAEMRGRILECVDRALTADPRSVYGWAMHGTSRFYLLRDWSAAEASLLRALDLSPSSAHSHMLLALFLVAVGRIEEALDHARQALVLDPLNPVRSVAVAHCFLALSERGRARRVLEEARDLEPEHGATNQFLANVCWLEEDEAAAIRHERIWWARDPTVAEILAPAGVGRSHLVRAADRLARRAAESYVQPTEVARLYAHGGRRREALDWLEEALRVEDLRLVDGFRLDGPWTALRGEPRYREIGRQLGLPGYS